MCRLHIGSILHVDQHGKIRLDLLRRMLRPALRFCLRNSIGVLEVLETVKTVLVELAADEIERGKNKVTVSRISVMTGMNRRDVTRIYREGESIENQPNLVTRVLGQWEQDVRFLTKSQNPKVLTYKGEDSEFKQLVESVSKDINPATMLFELERQGAVEKVRNSVKLKRTVHYFQEVPEKGLELLSRDTEIIVRAVEENLFESQKTRNLHLHTEYDNIFIKDLPMVREWLFKQGALFHKRTRDFLSRYDKDINPNPKEEGGGKVVLGAFSWTTKETEK